MVTFRRRSPVCFKSRPAQTEQREAWEVVLQYDNEGEGPFLIDLSHRTKWDVQDTNISQIQPEGLAIPETPGECAIQNGLVINRLNCTQATVWHLWGDSPAIPQKLAYTDVTEAFALSALAGRGADVFPIIEKVTPLDILSPDKKPPFLIQGSVFRVPCQIVVLGEKDNASAVLIACSRGYGQSMADELLDAGFQGGLRPGGEVAFSNLVKRLSV